MTKTCDECGEAYEEYAVVLTTDDGISPTEGLEEFSDMREQGENLCPECLDKRI